MELTLHWVIKQGFVKKDERTLSFKNRLGAKPNSLNYSLSFKAGDKINLAWKKRLVAQLNNRFRQDTKAIVFVGTKRYELSGRNKRHFANNLANLILHERHNSREHIDNRNMFNALNPLK